MEDFKKKFRLVFIPYLLLLMVCLAGYSFFNWYFYLRKELIVVPDVVMLIIVPILFSVVMVLVCLRTRLRLLTVTTKKGSPQAALIMLSIVAIATPLCLFQHLLVTATGTLTKVNIPADIEIAPRTKYYSVAQFSGLKDYALRKITRSTSNKGRRYTHHLYIVMPLVDTLPQGISTDKREAYRQIFQGKGVPQIWLGMAYEYEIKRKKYTEEGRKNFEDTSFKNFLQHDFSKITYMERPGRNNSDKGYRKAVVENYELRNPEKLTVLVAHFEPFERRNDTRLAWAIGGTLFCAAMLLLVFAIYRWDEGRLIEFERESGVF